jgi:hypothetical protein
MVSEESSTNQIISENSSKPTGKVSIVPDVQADGRRKIQIVTECQSESDEFVAKKTATEPSPN